MRFNEREMRNWAKSNLGDKEGRLNYKAPKEGYKERWFKLCGNLLFYFRTTDLGSMASDEALGVLVLENITVQMEPIADRPFVFSIGERDQKHYFSGQTSQQCQDWIVMLKGASFKQIQNRVNILRERIMKKSGRDPFDDQGYARRKPASFYASNKMDLDPLGSTANTRPVSTPIIYKPTRPAPARPTSTSATRPPPRAVPVSVPTVPLLPPPAGVPPAPNRPASTLVPHRPAPGVPTSATMKHTPMGVPLLPTGMESAAVPTTKTQSNTLDASQNIINFDDLLSQPLPPSKGQQKSKASKDLFSGHTGQSSFLNWETFD